MHFICRSFIGKNTPNWWSQYWENEPDDSTKDTKGHLFGLISLSSTNFDSLSQSGHELIDLLNAQYFSSLSNSILDNLTQTVEKIQSQLKSDQQLDLALAVIVNDQLFLIVFGDIEISLQRQDQISHLLQGNKNSSSVICGPIQTSDRIFISSSKFNQIFTWEKIKNILLDDKIQNIEENFLSHLYSLEQQDFLSAALIEIHNETDINETKKDSISEPQMPISNPISEKNISKISPVYVRQPLNFKIGNHQKIRLFIALLLLIGLSISFYFGHQKNLSSQAETQFTQYKLQLEQKLNNISAIKSLDLESANTTAKEAKTIIENMDSLKIHSDEVAQYRSQINSLLSQTGDSNSVNYEMIYDTSLITNNPQFSKILFSKDLIYLLDSSTGRIDTLNPSQHSTKNIIVSNSIKSAKKILLDNNQIYLLFDNQIKLVEKDSLTSSLNFDNYSSVRPTDVQFWNGSVYVLDSQNQSIWKFTPNASGFSEPQNWLKNNLKLEIGSKLLAIDGQVWTLTSSGLIYLYTNGLSDNFNQKQSPNTSSVLSFSVNPDSDYLLIVDTSKFIYVYQKNGQLVSKFNLDKFDILDSTFNPNNKTIYFLASDQKIYKITL